MQSLANLNGEIMPVEEAKISVWDRGFLFGDAVYEVFRLYQGRCWLEDEHLRRLRRSLAELQFEPIDLERLMARVQKTIAASRVQEGTVYIQLTRGEAPRTHYFPSPPVSPNEIIIVRPYDDGPTAELRRRGAAIVSHPDLRWGRCDIKSTNLLGNVLAVETARRAGAVEAVLIDAEGLVTEATHSSLIWVRDGLVGGTPEGPEILPGTTRQLLGRLLDRESLSFKPERVTLEQLRAADEVVLAGTTIEVLPVISIDGKAVANGKPGVIAERLQNAYQRELEEWLAGPS